MVAASPILGGGPLPQEPSQPQGLPMPGAPNFPEGGQSRYETGQHLVQTLGQGVAFTQGGNDQKAVHDQTGMIYYGNAGAPTPAPAQASAPPTAIPSTPSTPGSGRRRRLSAPGQQDEQAKAQTAQTTQAPAQQQAAAAPAPPREFTIGAPAAGVAEGPEPLDGPNSPVEVSDGRGMAVAQQAVDDELPPEPLDNPRRLLVWPAPDVATQQALSDRGYRPVIVHSREEVDAQIAAYPAALFVDPLTGPDHQDRAAVAASGGGRRRGAGAGHGGSGAGDPRGGVRRRSGRTPQGARPARQRAAPAAGAADRGAR